MYRHHPQTQEVVDLVESGAIGKVRMVEANFCYNSSLGPESRLVAKELGGGAILDIGCYGMSFCRLIAGRAQDRLFAEPLELQAVGHLDPQSRTDMWTTAIMRFEGDIVGKASAALRLNMPKGGYIYGEKGRITVDDPWHCKGEIRVERDGDEAVELIPADTSKYLYAYEIESFTREIQGQPIGVKEVAMRYDDTLGNMKALDRWRMEIGLAYEADRVR
jgi:predicted dehydrogenase